MKDLSWYMAGYMDALPKFMPKRVKFRAAMSEVYEHGYSFLEVLGSAKELKKQRLI